MGGLTLAACALVPQYQRRQVRRRTVRRVRAEMARHDWPVEDEDTPNHPLVPVPRTGRERVRVVGSAPAAADPTTLHAQRRAS